MILGKVLVENCSQWFVKKKLLGAAAVVLAWAVLDAGARAGLPAAPTAAAGLLCGERTQDSASHKKCSYGYDAHDKDGVDHMKSPKVSCGSDAGHSLDSDVENQCQA